MNALYIFKFLNNISFESLGIPNNYIHYWDTMVRRKKLASTENTFKWNK